MAIQVIQLQFMIRLEKGETILWYDIVYDHNHVLHDLPPKQKKNTGLEEEVIALSNLE